MGIWNTARCIYGIKISYKQMKKLTVSDLYPEGYDLALDKNHEVYKPEGYAHDKDFKISLLASRPYYDCEFWDHEFFLGAEILNATAKKIIKIQKIIVKDLKAFCLKYDIPYIEDSEDNEDEDNEDEDNEDEDNEDEDEDSGKVRIRAVPDIC